MQTRPDRRHFLAAAGALALGGALAACRAPTESAAPTPGPGAEPMPEPPVLPTGFVGHGAPTLALDEVKGADLARWGASCARPRAVLVVSAHWEADPVTLGATTTVPLVYDFYGFPKPLYQVTYAAPGAPELARRVADLLAPAPVRSEPQRGLDHGAWVPLKWLLPGADVPVLQVSLPTADPARLFELGRRLAPLRAEGVWILGSGNVVHNLRQVDFRPDAPVPAWATDFDAWVAERLTTGDVDGLLQVHRQPLIRTAHPTVEHLSPLLVAAGAAWGAGGTTAAHFPVTGFEFGSIARRCVQFA